VLGHLAFATATIESFKLGGKVLGTHILDLGTGLLRPDRFTNQGPVEM